MAGSDGYLRPVLVGCYGDYLEVFVSKETGGSAFPMLGNVGYNSDWQTEDGMTLRDYFAAKAINGILSDPDAGLLNDDLNRYAGIAYKVADAMLAARNATE